ILRNKKRARSVGKGIVEHAHENKTRHHKLQVGHLYVKTHSVPETHSKNQQIKSGRHHRSQKSLARNGFDSQELLFEEGGKAKPSVLFELVSAGKITGAL